MCANLFVCLFVCFFERINSSSSKVDYKNQQTVFAPVLKNAQPKGKIPPSTFKFILSPNFSEKKIEPTTSPGGRVSFQS